MSKRKVNNNNTPIKKPRLSDENRLSILYPELVKEWDFDLNDKGPDEYSKGSKVKTYWICKNNKEHKWKASIGDRTRGGTGCPHCNSSTIVRDSNRLSIFHPELIQEWDFDLNDKGPDEYSKGSDKKVHWICKNNNEHKWEALIKDRTKGKSCPYCNSNHIVRDSNRLSIFYPELIQEWDFGLNDKGPDEYSKGSDKKVHWICKNNKEHKWEALIRNRTDKGSDCPECYGRGFKNQFYVNNMFEVLFNTVFETIRPEFLCNPRTNYNLELDGYNEKLKIAFEYNGIQHYEFHEYFHKSKEDLEYQQEKDKFKKEKCKELGILLIVIPYTKNTKELIDNFVVNELNKNGYNFNIEMLKELNY